MITLRMSGRPDGTPKMPVRYRIRITEDRTDSIVDDLREYSQDVFREAGRRTWGKLEKPISDAIRQPAPARRGQWAGWSPDPEADARARRWWHWAVKTGRVKTDGRHYIRTGNFQKAFDIRFVVQDDYYDLLVLANKKGTDSKGRFKYRWVVGTFDRARGNRWRIPGHRKTGWQWIRTTADKQFDLFEADTRKEYRRILAERRAR